MRYIFTTILLFTALFSYTQKKLNVLSYYAVNNTIDGQPKINQNNVLRFYPVFAFRQVTQEVIVTVYHGGKVYRKAADPYMDSLYWQAILPDFQLGESIQRYEVETKIGLNRLDQFRDSLNNIQSSYKRLQSKIQSIEVELDSAVLSDAMNNLVDNIEELESSSNKMIVSIENYFIDTLKISKTYKSIYDSLSRSLSKQNFSLRNLLRQRKETTYLDSLLGVGGPDYNVSNGSVVSNTIYVGLNEVFEELERVRSNSLKRDTIFILNLFDSVNVSNTNYQSDEVRRAYVYIRDSLKKAIKHSDSLFKVKIDSLSPINRYTFIDTTWNRDGDSIYLRPVRLALLDYYTNIESYYKLDSVKIASYFKWLQDSIIQINRHNIKAIRDSVIRDVSVARRRINNRRLEIDTILGSLEKIQQQDLDLDNTLFKLAVSKTAIEDTVKVRLIEELTDKKFTGIGIQKSDIILDSEALSWAKILYRNYKLKNRDLPALDPAEELGVFRIRYIPFPIVGNELAGPARGNFPIIFEAGLTFGNRSIVSNEFFDAPFSIKKFGVAVVFTPELFADDAKVVGLALTYDFNSYASLGLGANFGELAGDDPDPYFSLGINQKVFQAFQTAIKNVFASK